MAGKPINCGNQTGRMAALGQGQNPFAAILGCSDSRVPNETVFDQAPGHLFAVRVAGNYAATDGIGSIEYAVAVLGAPLILVLGHTGCGAIKATVAYVKDGTAVPGHIQDVVNALVPAVKAAKDLPGDWVANATTQNVRATMQALADRSDILRDAKAKGTIDIVGGVYDIGSSHVAFLS